VRGRAGTATARLTGLFRARRQYVDLGADSGEEQRSARDAERMSDLSDQRGDDR
jgi:hypothetical protein